MVDHVHTRLRDDGLEGLRDLVLQHGLGIAGSYILPCHTADTRHEPDIDIWMPYIEDVSARRRIVADTVSLLFMLGYPLPHTTRVSVKGAVYTRLHAVVETIYTFRCKGRRAVQLLVTKAGATLLDIVRGFDLLVLHQYYDGTRCVATECADEETRAMRLSVNTAHDGMRSQTLSEWVRTLGRVRKYQSRGFRIGESMHTDLVPLLAGCLRGLTVLRGSRNKTSLLPDRTEKLVRTWNKIVRHLGWPANGTGPLISLVGRETVDSLELRVAGTEGETVVPLGCPASMNAWTSVWWGGQPVLIATLVPFPTIYELPRSTCTPHAGESVYDHLEADDTVCGVFVSADPTNNFVVVADQALNTITRRQIDTAHTFTPANHVVDDITRLASSHRVVTFQLPSGNFYVPLVQVQELLDHPGSGVVQLMPTNICWEHVTRSDHALHDRPLSVHFIRRLPLRTR